jgi:YD repeat-containing protein
VIRQAAPEQAQLQSGGGGSTRTVAYSYDRLNRLTGANASVGDDYTYAYDRAGNCTSVTHNGTIKERKQAAQNLAAVLPTVFSIAIPTAATMCRLVGT